MKIKHRVPAAQMVRSDPITPEYQAEVDRTTARAEAAYARALKRLHAAEERLAQVQARRAPKRKQQIAELEAMVELRRTELETLHRMMTSSPASSMHRGTKAGHRHIPSPGIL